MSFDDIVFLDETGFNKHTNRYYGYSVQNTPAFINVPANKGVNNSVMCAISIDGVVGYECIRGSYNSNLFIDFILVKLVPYFRTRPNKILIMDNCRFHHTRDVANIFAQNNIVFKFLPAYSPQLNPIEEFFSMLKARFSCNKVANPGIGIFENLSLVFSCDFSSQCHGFYRNMSRWLEKARIRDSFI